MKDSFGKIGSLHWETISRSLDEKGHAHIRGLLSGTETWELRRLYERHAGFRKTVSMERHRFGRGEYKYFGYPLPDLIQRLRSELYAHLVPVANGWMTRLELETRFPDTHDALLDRCRQQGQDKPAVLILRYGEGDYNALHQDLYGSVYFPMQAVLFLNEPVRDYQGGEFVLVQQNPRAQSSVTVLTPREGDMLLFTTQFRPAPGPRGYHRVQVRHGVSEVHRGGRHTLGIIFHDSAA